MRGRYRSKVGTRRISIHPAQEPVEFIQNGQTMGQFFGPRQVGHFCNAKEKAAQGMAAIGQVQRRRRIDKVS